MEKVLIDKSKILEYISNQINSNIYKDHTDYWDLIDKIEKGIFDYKK